MIRVTKLDGTHFYLNPHLIEMIETTPDTTISVFPAKKLIVKDQLDEVLLNIIQYRKSIGISISDAEVNNRIVKGEQS